MDWLEIMRVHKGLDLFFNVSVPAAITKQNAFGHVLFICPDDELRQRFVSELIDAIQPLAVEKTCQLRSSEQIINLGKTIDRRIVRWDDTTTPKDIAAVLTNMNSRDALVLSKNEVQLSHEGAEMLRTALDEFAIDMVIGSGHSATPIRIDLPEFTFVVCSSKENEEILELESHFSYVIKVRKEELGEICEKAALMTAVEAGCSFLDEACQYIVKHSGNDCKTAINYANRVIEYMHHYHTIGTQITEEHTKMVLGSLGVNEHSEIVQAEDDTLLLLRDIQKKLNGLSTEVSNIKKILKDIQGEESDHTLTDIANALDRIEESM